MKRFVICICFALIAGCTPAVNKGSSLRIFTHEPSNQLRETNLINASELDDFRDGDIVFRVGFGKKMDGTYILYLTPLSEKRNLKVFIDRVTVSSTSFLYEKKLESNYSLLEMESKLYGHAIKVMEDIDVDSIPEKQASFTVKVFYNLNGTGKTMSFQIPATYFAAPIR